MAKLAKKDLLKLWSEQNMSSSCNLSNKKMILFRTDFFLTWVCKHFRLVELVVKFSQDWIVSEYILHIHKGTKFNDEITFELQQTDDFTTFSTADKVNSEQVALRFKY